MEARAEQRVRVRAPVESVWGECAQLHGLLRHAPEVVGLEAGDGEATIDVRLAWGRLSWTLDGTARIAESVAPERVAVDVVLAGLGLSFTGVVELSPAADDETNLTYRGALRSDHPVVNRLHGVFANITEFHVHATAGNLRDGAERRFQAEEQFLRRPPTGPG